MKKNIFLFINLFVCSFCSSALLAQSPSPKEKKTEQIIIRKNRDKETRMTIEVNGDSVTVNGKPLSEYNDGDVSILKKDLMDRGSHNFLYEPDNQMMNLDLIQNDDENATPHTFLGVITEKGNDGVKINEVMKGSAAEKSGLAKGDVINKLGSKNISSPEDLMDAVKSYKAGEEVKISYTRDDKKKDVKVKLGETKVNRKLIIRKDMRLNRGENNLNLTMPPMPKMNNDFFKYKYDTDKPKLGLKIEDTENNTGVKVLNVEEGSPADKAGLKKDDIISSFNGEKVNSVEELMDQVNDSEDNDNLNIKAMRNSTEMSFDIKIPKKLNSADL